MLQCGKNKGLLFAEVAALDKPYCGWVMSLPASANTFQKFSTYLRINHGGVLHVGKHKWKYFNEVLQDDPEYTEWVVSLGDPASSLGEFAEYVRHGHKPIHPDNDGAAPSPPGTEPIHPSPDFVCKICLLTPVKTVLLPCAHMTCESCATAIGTNACPFCRKHVRKKVRTFMC